MLNEIIELRALSESLTEEEFFRFCHENESVHIERDETGKIVIMPPSGFEADAFAQQLSSFLSAWNQKTKAGIVSGSSAGFILADKSMRSPDAAWISNDILNKIPKEEKAGFLRACPEFIIEVKSPTDRLPDLKKKIQAWIKNGAKLAWLVNPEDEVTWVYEEGKEPEVVKFDEVINGKSVLPEFEIKIASINKA